MLLPHSPQTGCRWVSQQPNGVKKKKKLLGTAERRETLAALSPVWSHCGGEGMVGRVSLTAAESRAAALPEAAEPWDRALLAELGLQLGLCRKPVACKGEVLWVKPDALRAATAALDAAASSPAHCARSPGSNSSSAVWRCSVITELFGLGPVLWYR